MFITEPLFRSYIFACFDNGKYSHMISYTHGVQYIAGKENPVVVPIEIIHVTQDRMEEGDLITPRTEGLVR